MLKNYMECVVSRKIVFFIYTWPALICLVIASRGAITISEVLLLVSAVSLVGLAVYFYNDIMDLEDDLKTIELGNQMKGLRPLGQKRVSKDALSKFIIFSAALGLLLASLLNMGVLITLSLYIILGVLYSTEPVRLKKRFLFKQLVIASGCGLSILAGAFAGGQITPLVIFLVLMDFALAMGVNPLVDIPDLMGDRAAGVRTIPAVIGPSMTVRFAIAVLTGIVGGGFIGYLGFGLNIALPLLVTLVAGALIYVITPLLSRYDDIVFTNFVVFKRVVPLYMIVQLVPLVGILF